MTLAQPGRVACGAITLKAGVKMQHATSHTEWLKARLADPEFAAEYLNAASEDDDPKVYLAALRHVVDARGGMASVAEKASLSRETLYRTL